jgi:hypothetical protein
MSPNSRPKAEEVPKNKKMGHDHIYHLPSSELDSHVKCINSDAAKKIPQYGS